MDKYARLVDELLELTSVERYFVAGVTSDNNLLVAGFREGYTNLYVYHSGSLVKLNRDPVNGIASHTPGVEKVVFYRDITRGREQYKIFMVSIDRPGVEEQVHEEQKPSRLFGVAYDGRTVAYASVHENGVGLYVVRGSRLWKVTDTPGIAMVTSVYGDIVAGVIMSSAAPQLFKPFAANISSNTFRVIEPPVKGNTPAVVVLPDGFIAYGVEGLREARVFVADPDTGKSVPHSVDKVVVGEGFTSILSLNYTSQGELIVIAKKKEKSRVLVGDEWLKLPEGLHLAAFEWGSEIAVTHTSHATPTRIIACRRGGDCRVVLEGKRPWWLDEVIAGFGFAETVSVDGAHVPLVYRLSGRARKPGPTVVLIHGGPFAEDADMWDTIALALQAAGFHVVQPNYRGSVGYGVDWTEKIIGDPCGLEVEDVLSAAKWAKDSGIASRLYVMGYSYGGYLTLCVLTKKPNVFEAGVAGASVTDWEEMYKLSDPAFRVFIDMLFAGKRSLWRDRSPINYVDNLAKPLLVIHAVNDTRTPLKPVLRFVEKAVENGKIVEAYFAPDIGHIINTAEDALKILLPALIFLTRIETSRAESSKRESL